MTMRIDSLGEAAAPSQITGRPNDVLQDAITAFSLSKRFGSVIAVDQLTFSCRAGSTFGLLGANGAGKSTLIKMLTTLLPPTSGTARIVDCDLAREPAAVRRKIGYVSQMLSADGELTGYENLLVAAKLYLIPRAERKLRIAQALEFMDLGEAGRRAVRQYSGGMIRRLEIAQSMLHRPAVLFLDEPSVGLDPAAKRVLWERIRQLRREFGTTILLTTHDMEEADQLCEAIGIMHRGQLVALDTPAALKAVVSSTATMDSVFIHFTGVTCSEGGELRDVSRSRITHHRLG